MVVLICASAGRGRDSARGAITRGWASPGPRLPHAQLAPTQALGVHIPCRSRASRTGCSSCCARRRSSSTLRRPARWTRPRSSELAHRGKGQAVGSQAPPVAFLSFAEPAACSASAHAQQPAPRPREYCAPDSAFPHAARQPRAPCSPPAAPRARRAKGRRGRHAHDEDAEDRELLQDEEGGGLSGGHRWGARRCERAWAAACSKRMGCAV